MDRERLTEDVKLHEGHSAKVYLDTVGVPTIGYGRNLKAVPLSADEVRAIVGDKQAETPEQLAAQLVLQLFYGIPLPAAELMLEHDLDRAARAARNLFPSFESLDAVRAEALVNMALNLGQGRLAKFVKLRAAIAMKDWPEAKRQALDSRWAIQVGNRATTLADRLERGQDALA